MMAHIQTERIVSALTQRGCEPVPAGNGYRAKCPCHNGDSVDVLAVSADGKIYCHKCEAKTGDVLKALGLAGQPTGGRNSKVTIDGKQVTLHGSEQSAINGITWSVFQKVGGTERAPERVHPYESPSGECIGVVLIWKFSDGRKETRQIRRHDCGWIAKGMLEPRPLYHLPDVIAADSVVVCEGEKSADALRVIGIEATTPTQGAKSPRKTDWSVLAGKDVTISVDNDDAGRDFGRSVIALIRDVAANIKVVEIKDDWSELPEKGDAADWIERFADVDSQELRRRFAELPNHFEAFDVPAIGNHALVKNVTVPPTASLSLSVHERVRVYVDDDEMATNDNVIDALTGTDNLFQMDGRLVQLVRPPKDRMSVSDVLVPHYLTPALLRERITNRVAFYGYDKNGDEVHKLIPKFCAETIHQRGVWDGIPHLGGIVASPVLRPDGSVLQTSGYDVASQLFADLQETYPAVPHDPTAAEVADSVNMLLDLVCDFPFVNDAHRAAWLAAILTPLAKHTHTGVTGPITLFDAPTAGSGKTILAELGGIICIGGEPPSMIWKSGETERSKAMLSKLMQRPQIILLDNVECELGGPTINKCVTDHIYEDRLLQKSEMAQVPVLAQIWVTGNNVQVVADTRRRVCHCRIEPSCERPETREGFKHQDVKGYARRNRKKLLCAALTMLRGYFSAGKPKQDLIPWGSFGGWSSVVRSSLVWAGLPDVGECMMSGNTQDDELLTGLEFIVAAFLILDPDFDGLTTKRVTEVLQSEHTTPGRDDLVQAFDSLTDKPISKIGSRQVGAALKKLKSKVCGEYKLTYGRDEKRRFWVLRPLQKMTSMTSLTSFEMNPIRTEAKNIGVMDSGSDSERKEGTPVFLAQKEGPAISRASLTSVMSLEADTTVTPPPVSAPGENRSNTLSDDDLRQLGKMFQ
ncbi:MAG: hypothetical protein ABGZ35_20070 [Planctomycetaceae bacterium]